MLHSLFASIWLKIHEDTNCLSKDKEKNVWLISSRMSFIDKTLVFTGWISYHIVLKNNNFIAETITITFPRLCCRCSNCSARCSFSGCFGRRTSCSCCWCWGCSRCCPAWCCQWRCSYSCCWCCFLNNNFHEKFNVLKRVLNSKKFYSYLVTWCCCIDVTIWPNTRILCRA